MKKSLLAIAITTTVIISSCNSEKVAEEVQVKAAKISLAGEVTNPSVSIPGLEEQIRKNPQDIDAKITLVQCYIQEARNTGRFHMYDEKSFKLVNEVLEKSPDNYLALCLKATVLLSGHNFSEAKTVAEAATKLNPHAAFAYGLLCDSYVELGNYSEAVKMADKMVSIRPDLRSYSRVSYLREIHGNLPGAIEAMKLAVSAGYPGLEQTSWVRVQLGQLYEKTGNWSKAEEQYQYALAERKDYPYGLAGMARVERNRNNISASIAYLDRAIQFIKDYSFALELYDIYKFNDIEKADKSYKTALSLLSSHEDSHDHGHAHHTASAESHDHSKEHAFKHNNNRELAWVYLKGYKFAEGLAFAEKEFKSRPDNIDAREVYAWAKFSVQDYKAARTIIEPALKTKFSNPDFLVRAGLIFIKSGDQEKGMEMISQALKTGFIHDSSLRNAAILTLKQA